LTSTPGGRPDLVFIGLGSNIGDKRKNLDRALDALSRSGVEPVLSSLLYRTEPLEIVDQEEFLNQVALCRSVLPLDRILGVCLETERVLGRVRTRDKGPRLIDLDLLLRGDEVRKTPGIEVPHPRLHLRRFVLIPLVEIAPDAWHPILKMTAAELLERCPDRSRVEPLSDGPGGSRGGRAGGVRPR